MPKFSVLSGLSNIWSRANDKLIGSNETGNPPDVISEPASRSADASYQACDSCSDATADAEGQVHTIEFGFWVSWSGRKDEQQERQEEQLQQLHNTIGKQPVNGGSLDEQVGSAMAVPDSEALDAAGSSHPVVAFQGEDVWLDVLTLLFCCFFIFFIPLLCLRLRRHIKEKKRLNEIAPATTTEDKGMQTESSWERMEHAWISQGGECFHADHQCRAIRRLDTTKKRYCKICAANVCVQQTKGS